MPFHPRGAEERFERGVAKGREEPEGVGVERRFQLQAAVGHLDVMVVVGGHRSIGLRAHLFQLDLDADRLPVLLGQLVQGRIAKLDGIDQIDDQWFAIGSQPEAVGPFLKPDLIQKRVGCVRIILDVFGEPLGLGERYGPVDGHALGRLAQAETQSLVDLIPVQRQRHGAVPARVGEQLSQDGVFMSGVEYIGAAIAGALGHLDIVVALILILLEERQAANLQCLGLILDLAVDDLQLE